MSSDGPAAGTEKPTDAPGDADAADAPEIDEGRYVYCLVRTTGEESFETNGVEDEPVRVVAIEGTDGTDGDPGRGTEGDSGRGTDGDSDLGTADTSGTGDGGAIAAVVHDCDDVYDSADPTEIRRWLVRHQRVVDDAGEAFGTPLPFQFDTIIRGDDDAVREWLRSERDAIANALDGLAGHWEYRIEVVRTEPVDEETLAADDDRLSQLRDEVEDAGPGRAHLLEKRYEDRLKELRDHRRERRTDEVFERIAPHVREVHELEPSPATSIAADAGAGEGGSDADESGDDGETICRLTVLAHEDDEASLGSALDQVAADPGLEVRFTGPWPPYTFTPEFGGGAESDASEASDGRGPG